MKTTATTTRALFLIAAVLLAAPSARAHKLLLFATHSGTTVTGRAYFPGGIRAQGIPVTLSDSSGHVLATASTDTNGAFRLPAPRLPACTLTAETVDGHRAVFHLALAAATPGDAAPPADSPAPHASSPPPAPDSELAAQIQALRDHLYLHDILGGVGYILGIWGTICFLLARRRQPPRPETGKKDLRP